MAAADIITSLIKIFIIILPGYLLSKLGIMTMAHTRGLSSLITSVTFPCLIVISMQLEFSEEILSNCKLAIIIFACITAITTIIAKLMGTLVKLPKTQSGVFTFMLIFGNTGFLGLPVLNSLFGAEAVLYGALCDALYNIFIFTVGIQFIIPASENIKKADMARKALKQSLNPCFFGLIIGMILFVTGTAIPEIIAEPMASIGNITSPLAMIVVGSHLAKIKFKDMITSLPAYWVCFLKLLAVPLIGLVLVKLIIGTGSLLSSVLIIESAMPVTMSSVIFSEQYKADVSFAVKGTLLSTVMCIITIPVFAILLQYI